MSILHVVRCEQYEKCKQEFSVGSNTTASDFTPDTWIVLFEGNPRLNEGWHFCSKECLFDWMMGHWEISGGFKSHEPPACKARRFLLWDESANSTEGVLWADGSVILEGGDPPYETWDKFKAQNEGSGVQWIDQEVAE